MLPQLPIDLQGLEVNAWLENASTVGGDLYDIIYQGKNNVTLVIADVCGHNVAAAMNLVNCRGHLRALLSKESNPAKVLTLLNSLLHDDLSKSHQFVSLLLIKLDLAKLTAKIASAGHDAPWVFEKNKIFSLEQKIPSGMLLGLDPKTKYSSCLIKLKKNSTLLLYTDGLPELKNAKGEIFGRKRFYSFLKEQKNMGSQTLLEAVKQMVASYKKQTPFADDVTVVTATFSLEALTT
ncbi:MAG: hypothetical protein ACD_73C00333G0008 [uncultured bacterium]|nr:MAG: hypothetical protein ACD_73C00333G0008 [uncultured bacterium]